MVKEQNFAGIMQAVDMLRALSNPNRLAILCLLLEGEMSVGAIGEHVDLSQSALSQHLAKLRTLDLVKTRRDQQTIWYSLDSEETKVIIDVLHQLYCNKPDK